MTTPDNFLVRSLLPIALYLAIQSVCMSQVQDGTLDTAFAQAGAATLYVPGYTAECTAVTLSDDDGILVAGHGWAGGDNYAVVVARLNSDGEIDTSFGTQGYSIFRLANGGIARVEAIKQRITGEIVLAIQTNSGVLLKELSNSGQFDAGFNVTFSSGTDCTVADFQLLPNGKVLACGTHRRTSLANSDSDGWVAQFLGTGALDPSFGIGGRVVFSFATLDQRCECLAVQPDGKILVGGAYAGFGSAVGSAPPSVHRLRANGTMDSSFSAPIASKVALARAPVSHLALDSSGRVMVVCKISDSTGSFNLFRLRIDGSLDEEFSSDGMQSFQFGSGHSFDFVCGLDLQPDSKICVAGGSFNGSGPWHYVARRFFWDGLPDSSYGINGIASCLPGGANTAPSTSITQSDGKLVVAGRIAGSGYATAMGLVRYGAGPQNPPPGISILHHPDSSSGPVGTEVTLSVLADTDPAGGTLNYLWFKNGVRVPSSNSSALAFTLTLQTEGDYTVLVSNGLTSLTSNSAVIRSVSPPVIVDPPTSEKALYGGSATFSFNCSGRTPTICELFHGSTLVSTQTLQGTSGSFMLTNISASDAGAYHLVLTNADGSSVSGEFALEVFVDPVIFGEPPNQIWRTGENAALRVLALSKNPGTIQWLLNGKVHPNSLPYYDYISLEPVTMADAGIYHGVFAGLSGTAFSKPIQVSVVDSEPRKVLAARGSTGSITVKYSGPIARFAWFRGEVALADDQKYQGTTSKTLKILDAAPSDEGTYRCQLFLDSAIDAWSGDQLFSVTDQPPQLTGISLPIANVLQQYSYSIQTVIPFNRVQISGLPKGLKYDEIGGFISGMPTVAGLFSLKVTAFNPSGSSATVRLPMVVEGLPLPLSGRQVGTVDLIQNGTPSLTSIYISRSGAFSGSISFSPLNGHVYSIPFRGQLGEFDGAQYLATVPVRIPGAVKSQPSFLRVFAVPGGSVSGDVTFTRNEGGSEREYISGFGLSMVPWSKQRPATEFAAVYNIGLLVSPLTQFGPAGGGYCRINVKADGTVSGVARLSDGSSFSGRFYLLESSLLLHRWLYGGRGYFGGELSITLGNGPDYWDTKIDGTSIRWGKKGSSTSKSPNFPFGFEADVSVFGSRYLPPNVPYLTGRLPLNLEERPDNARFYFGEPYLPSEIAFTLDAKGNGRSATRVYMDTPHVELPSIRVNPKTGSYYGTAVYYEPSSIDLPDGGMRDVIYRYTFPFQGLICREGNSLQAGGVGYSRALYKIPYVDDNGNERTLRLYQSFPVGFGPNSY